MWIILTIIRQIDCKLTEKISGIDLLFLLPQWKFFAPNPGDIDIHLLVRFSEGETLSQWYETPITAHFPDKFRWTRGLFNPYRRLEKMIFDFTNEVRILKAEISQVRHLSEYILLLRFVEILARQRGANQVQFMLAGSNLTLLNDIEVIIISDVHLIMPD